mmetsp:Transcript_92713/g.271412  ORF Transcript_92713/g.271412 Transcript_92713/m.271412 type:complete len:210 (-) Transcript_92713:3745-4374(-)
MASASFFAFSSEASTAALASLMAFSSNDSAGASGGSCLPISFCLLATGCVCFLVPPCCSSASLAPDTRFLSCSILTLCRFTCIFSCRSFDLTSESVALCCNRMLAAHSPTFCSTCAATSAHRLLRPSMCATMLSTLAAEESDNSTPASPSGLCSVAQPSVPFRTRRHFAHVAPSLSCCSTISSTSPTSSAPTSAPPAGASVTGSRDWQT